VTFNTPDPFSVQSWPRAAPSTRSSVVYAVTDVIRSFMPGRTAGSDMVLPAGVRTDGPELPGVRTVNTGTSAVRTTFSVTLPSRYFSIPLRPRVPMTIMSVSSSAYFVIFVWGLPLRSA